MVLVGALLLAFSFAGQTPFDEKLNRAKEFFYQEKYQDSERLILEARAIDPTDPESYEFRTTILLFRLRDLTGIDVARQGKATKTLATCAACPEMLRQFEADTAEGLRLARLVLTQKPDDERATFIIAKLDLNKLWLNLKILNKMKGWREYQEARKFLAKVLARNPNHSRALIASAWINYIVADRIFLLRAVLGGGSKKTALKQLRQAASCGQCDAFDRSEAGFSLLDILKQEKMFAEAAVLARELSVRYPENASLAQFAGQKTR